MQSINFQASLGNMAMASFPTTLIFSNELPQFHLHCFLGLQPQEEVQNVVILAHY